jgi:succinoglycan biosynthesis protein ExoM
MLRRLLASLLAQETAGEFVSAIHVVDNDSHRSGESVVREFFESGAPVTYDVEPVQNISLARNRSLAAASGEFVATIDDDVYAAPSWLRSHIRALRSANGDVVHGPIVPEFSNRAAAWLRDCHLFHSPDLPTGLSDSHPFTTSNAVFRRSLIRDLAEPFDPLLGLTGGSDGKFFLSMKERGCRMLWCRDGVVHYPVPQERETLRWVLQRKFRYGNVVPDIQPQYVDIRGFGYRLKNAARLGGVASLRFLRGSRDEAVRLSVDAMIESAFVAGFVMRKCGYRYEEYRVR